MADIYEIPDTEEEHQYCDIILPDDEPGNSKPQLATKTGTSEPQPCTSSGKDASMWGNSTKACQHIVLCIHTVLILALIGTSVYMLQMPKPDEPVLNGGWSQWGVWSTCSMTCGSGVTTRFRRCDSPAPSSTGAGCTGDPMEADSCGVVRCPVQVVGFSARFRLEGSPEHQMKYKIVLANEGGGYNASTGIFTCPVGGMYHLSLTLIKNYNFNGSVSCTIFKNGDYMIRAYTKPGHTPLLGNYAAVNMAYVRLAVGDTVKVANCTTPIESAIWLSTFSGFMVTPDG